MRARRSAVCVGAIAGLLGSATAMASGPPEASGETLTVWIMQGTNADAQPFFDDVGTAFTEATGATLDVQFVEWAEAKDRFSTAIAGDSLPDVAEMGTTWTPEYADAGVLMDISEQVAGTGITDDLVPALLEAGTVDGGVYGMPWYAGVRSIIYRTDVFEAAGITPPTTWDELVAAGDAIRESNPDMMPMPIPGDSEYSLAPFLWGAGGELATGEGEEWTSGLDSAEAQEGIAFYTGLATEHEFSTPAASTWNEADARDAFVNGEAAMLIAGNWVPTAIVAANPELEGKLGAFSIPGPDGGIAPSFLGGSHLSIFEGTEQEELAWAFVEMMTTGEFAGRWGDESGFFPGTLSLLADIEASDDPLVTPFVQQMSEGGRTVPVTPLYGVVQGDKTIAAMLQSILSGDATVEEAAATAAQEMNDTFAGG